MKRGKRMKKLNANEWNENVFEAIGKRWMLITAKDPESGKYNTMTASWGGMGILWNKPVCFLFIRPQRYTFEFTERTSCISLSFFPEEYRADLRTLGTLSGRDGDKLQKTSLSAVDNGDYVSFAEADVVIHATKLYRSDIAPEGFVDLSLLSNYPQNDFHRMYICEINEILINN